ncbi:MAG: porin family protein [Muribaculaceae bacterium]
MAKIIIATLFAATCIFSAAPVLAQKHYQANIAVGGKAGVTLSKVNFSPSVKQGWNIGETAGVTFRYMEEKHFGLILEANITRAGWKENFENTNFNYSRTLTYLQVPILTHIYFGSRRFRGFFNLGPQLGYYLGESISANFDYTNVQSVPDFPINNRYLDQLTMDVKSKFDYGLAFGLGTEFIAKRKHSISLEARLYYGLGSVFPSNKKDTFSASSNMTLSITAGYAFRVR